MTGENKKIRVALGMSGGVDSSVAAFLLKKQGYEVVGLFMKLWHDPSCDVSRENSCCDEQAELDARKVAKLLGIQFYVVDARKPFKKEITDYFIEEYKNFRTPNPCVKCNKSIKFGWLLDYAEKLGCDYLATGHYARIFNSIELKVKSQKLRVKHIAIPDPGGSLGSKAGIQELSHRFPNTSLKNTVGSENDKDNMILYLYKGIDSTKDQSYFLYQLTQEQLSKIIFPLGEMTKTEVRKIAQENQLPVYEKIESQEICFIPDSDYREFLKRYLPADYFKPGRIVDKDGWTIGSHDGLVNFTIGQRRGISQNTKSKTQDTKALYVLGFNAGKNELIVGKDDELNQDQFTIENAHFIDPIVEERSEENEISNISVKIRYRSVEIPCTIKPIIHTSKFLICLKQPARAIAPGQSAVFYLGDKVIGGGIIASKTDYL